MLNLEPQNDNDENEEKERPQLFKNLSFLFKRHNQSEITATRNNLQLGRRFFHLTNGVIIATMYHLFLTHKQLVYILGLTASLLYLFEQVRISYPELASKLKWVSRILLRAEEQLKESAAVPYAMALLLTALSFPKEVSLIAILTLSIADPMSAIIGISFGQHKIRDNKSWEGSIAFFTTTTLAAFLILYNYHPGLLGSDIKASILIGFFAAFAETIPIRIDDNLTIPLSTALIAWFFCTLLYIPVGSI